MLNSTLTHYVQVYNLETRFQIKISSLSYILKKNKFLFLFLNFYFDEHYSFTSSQQALIIVVYLFFMSVSDIMSYREYQIMVMMIIVVLTSIQINSVSNRINFMVLTLWITFVKDSLFKKLVYLSFSSSAFFFY